MRTLRLALAQVDSTVGDLRGNGLLVRRWLAKAEAAEADLAVFPEMTLTGYPPEDLVLRPAFIDDSIATLKRLATDVGRTAAVVGFVDRSRHGIHNAAALLYNGRIRGIYHKQHLPNYGVFDEERTFTPGRDPAMFEIRGVCTALTICEDAWVERGPAARAGRLGAEVVVNVSASPYHRAKGRERRELFSGRAREARSFFALCNLVGGQDEL
ncbi:MAG: nitrilase-related carbon-nitrogen hydrolase, partial [Actinomycetota bacterium]